MHRFRLADEASMQPFLDVVNDKTLRHALSFGVGYIHDTQSAQERKVVDALFDMGAIQVCCGALVVTEYV